MSLTDQEQVILRAIEKVGSNGIAEISKVVKAVGYPKAATKRTLARLAQQGLVTIYRHDYAQSLTPAQRKLMLRLKDGQGNWHYYNAVSMRKRNPRGSQSAYDKKLAEYVRKLQTEGLAANQIADRVFQRFGQIVHRVNQGEIVMRGIKGRDYIVKLRNPKSKVSYARWEVVFINPLYIYIKYEPDKGMDLAAAKRDAYTALGGEFGETHVRQLIIKLKGDPVVLSKLPDNVDDMKGAKGWAWIGPGPRKNPKGKTALKRTGRALKGFARGALSAGSEILGAGAMALNPTAKLSRWKTLQKKEQLIRKQLYRLVERDYHKATTDQQRRTLLEKKWSLEGRLKDIAKEKQKLFERGRANPKRRRNSEKKDSDHPIEVTKHWRAGPPGYLTPWQRAHHAGQKQLFETGIKPAKRNAAKPSKIVYRAEVFSDGFKIHDNHGHHSRKIVYNSHSERITSKREAREQAAQFIKLLREGVFTLENPKGGHASRASRASKKSSSRNHRVANRSRKKVSTAAKRKSVVKSRKAPASKPVGRAIKKSSGLLKGKRRNTAATEVRQLKGRAIDALEALGLRGVVATDSAYPSVQISKTPENLALLKQHGLARSASTDGKWYYFLSGVALLKKVIGMRRNPSAESIRKTFAGSVSGERDLFFPQGTPTGKLAKLGKLVLIQTEKGTIKPVHGTAWLCADTKERLHIGSTTNAPLFDGPARSFGKVTKVEYESSKPHLGYKGPIIWFHHMGERGGTKPTLHADGKGGLKFRGGRYTLTTRGIEH